MPNRWLDSILYSCSIRALAVLYLRTINFCVYSYFSQRHKDSLTRGLRLAHVILHWVGFLG